ncbi:MMPL family transporter, partial [Streptomyces sp. Act-28]
MAATARWCMRHRFVVVLLWLAALCGVTAAAGIAGSAYSNDYQLPSTESGRAAAVLREAFPGRSGDSGTVVWHTERGDVRGGAVERRITAMLDEVAALPGVTAVTTPYGPAGLPGAAADATRTAVREVETVDGRISEDGRTAYATVTFDRLAGDIPEAQARALVDTARAAAGEEGMKVSEQGA